MESGEEEKKAAFQPGLIVLLVALPFIGGAVLFSWTLYDALACAAEGGECVVALPTSVFFSVLGLALMALPGLAALVFALYESPGAKGNNEWGGLK